MEKEQLLDRLIMDRLVYVQDDMVWTRWLRKPTGKRWRIVTATVAEVMRDGRKVVLLGWNNANGTVTEYVYAVSEVRKRCESSDLAANGTQPKWQRIARSSRQHLLLPKPERVYVGKLDVKRADAFDAQCKELGVTASSAVSALLVWATLDDNLTQIVLESKDMYGAAE